jgi:hypothetical protein
VIVSIIVLVTVAIGVVDGSSIIPTIPVLTAQIITSCTKYREGAQVIAVVVRNVETSVNPFVTSVGISVGVRAKTALVKLSIIPITT